MIKLCLIGKNISHSRSPEIYKALLHEELQYDLLDFKSSDQIPPAKELLEKYTGVSITSPYKRHFLDQVELNDEVRELGAINCLYHENGKMKGANTDWEALQKLFPNHVHSQVAILGSGAMSKLFQIYLKKKQIPYVVYERKIHGDLNQIDYKDFGLIINCCSRDFNFSNELLPQNTFWDMNYSMIHQGIIPNYFDGTKLLELQAHYALEHWSLL